MSDNWLDDAVENATGNVPYFEDAIVDVFGAFGKMKTNGCPDEFILASIQDEAGVFKGMVLFDLWKKHLEDEKYIKEQGK